MPAVPCRELVAAKVLTVLQAIAGISFERNRRAALGDDDFKGGDARGVLFEEDEEPSDNFTGEDAFDLPFAAQVAFKLSGEDAATLANTWRAQLQKTLLADRTLGGLARDLQIVAPGDWVGADIESDHVEGFVLAFNVRYATVEGDPFTFSN
jgi:hypothetical protein